MNNHPLGLVYHQEMGVLIYDIQRDILGNSGNGCCIRDFQQNGIPCLEFEIFGCLTAIGQDVPVGN